jgi:hypothetical protein
VYIYIYIYYIDRCRHKGSRKRGVGGGPDFER